MACYGSVKRVPNVSPAEGHSGYPLTGHWPGQHGCMARIGLRNGQNGTNGALARRRSKYTEVEIDAGLTAVAMASGNTRGAARALLQAGQRRVPESTLKRWVDRMYAQRYRQIQEQILPELNAQMAEVHDQLVIAYSDLQQQALEKAREGLPNAKASEAAGVFKSAAIAAGINAEGVSSKRPPTQIREDRSAGDILKIMAEKYPGVVKVDAGLVEAEDVEITERDGAPNVIEFPPRPGEGTAEALRDPAADVTADPHT